MTSFWEELYAQHAFKPTPSLWELGEAHVPFEELGVTKPPEPRISTHVNEGDGLVLLVGGPGHGKSSVFAYVAGQLDKHPDSGRRYLTLFVPVAARAEPSMTLDRFGKEVAFEFLAALAPVLPKAEKGKLERKLAAQVSRQYTPSVFNARLVGKLPGLDGELGVKMGHEVVSVVGEERLDSRGGLQTLGTIAREHGYELVVMVEDTDAWSIRGDGPEVAEAFFGRVLRPLVSDADVVVTVAVQDRWAGERYFQEIEERAIACLQMPAITNLPRARSAVAPVIERRVRRVLDDRTPADPLAALFSGSALDALANDLAQEGSFRDPLERLRNTLDHFSDALPERIHADHLIEGGG